MRFFVLIPLGFTTVALFLPQGQQQEVRMDDSAKYLENQDIYKAFNVSKYHWLFGFDYISPHTKNKSCVFFDIEDLSEEGMNYSSNFIKNQSRGQIEYTGTFCSTNEREGVKRLYFDALFATLRNGSWPMYYTLGFSDYMGCSIFHVENMTRGCMVLLSDSVGNGEMSSNCTEVYKNICRQNITHQVYNKSCEIPIKK
uniref:Putative lipocalin-2 1 n=1 Tax=Amblyomma aureolatum TaxID=187763 RepID=A0A1E1WXR7_9ACAR